MRSRTFPTQFDPVPRRPRVLVLVALVFGALTAESVRGERFYLDLKWGHADFERDFGRDHPWTFDDEADAAGLALGFDVLPWLAIEAGYQHAGGIEGGGSACLPNRACIELFAEVETDLHVLEASALPQWEFGRVTVFGRLGWAHLRQEIDVLSLDLGDIGHVSESGLLLGLGARVRLTPRLEAVVERKEADFDLEAWNLGLGLRF